MQRQSGLRRALPFILLAGALAVPAGVVGVYYYQEGKQASRRSQAFADLSQCLMGELAPSHEEVAGKLTKVQARAALLPDDARWPAAGQPWPQRCAEHGKDMMHAVRESSLMDGHPKDELLKELEVLVNELQKPDAQSTYLARSVVAVWTKAAVGEVEVGKKSSVSGPPPAVMLEGDPKSLELPFIDLTHVPGGPVWHFFASRTGNPGLGLEATTMGSCAPSAEGLTCEEFKAVNRADPRGTWDSPAFIPLADGRSLRLLNGANLVTLSTDFKGATQVHVDDKGTVFAMNMVLVPRKKKKKGKGADEPLKDPDTGEPIQDFRVHLLAQPLGKEVIRVDLVEGLEKIVPDTTFIVAQLMGKNIVVNSGTDQDPKFVRIPFDDLGRLAEPIAMPADPHAEGSPTITRAGSHFVMQAGLGSMKPKLLYFDGKDWSPPVVTPVGEKGLRNFIASASGSFSIGQRMVCGQTGCSEVFSQQDAVRALLSGPRSSGPRSELDVVGDRVFYAWAGDDGNGVFVHVGGPGAPKEGTDIVILESAGNKSPREIGVFGGPEVGLVFAQLEKTMIGVRVLKDGSVKPAKVTWK